MDRNPGEHRNKQLPSNAFKHKVILGVTAMSLFAAPTASVSFAATPTTASAASQITSVSQYVKPVHLTSKSYINLVDVSLSPVDQGQIAAFTIAISNNDSKVLDLTDYWFRLTNSAGSTYPVKTSASDSKVTQVSPNSTAYITLYAKVGETTKLDSLQFKVIKFDFSTPTYERVLGQFSFPKNYTNNVASTSYKAIYFNTTKVYSKISSATVGQSGDNNLVTLNFVYNNVGKKSVTLSKYKYYIVTANGIMYEATPSDTSDLVMDPLVRKEVQLTASIPSQLSTTGWKLIVQRSDGTDSDVLLPVGVYNIKFGNGSTSAPASDSFTYATTNGNLEMKLLQVQRDPWENQDVLSARIRVTNKSNNSLTLPALTGYFYLDDKVQVDFKTIATNNQFALNPGGYVDVDVYAKLPSNYKYTSVKLIVNDKVDDKTTVKAGELASTAFLSQIPIYAVDKSYDVTRDGSEMSGVINSVNVYNNVTSKIFNVQMTLTSSEQRTIDPVKLSGVFVNDNGDIFPATATYGDGRVNPSSKALVNFSAALPQSYNSSNLRLIVGESVSDDKYTSGTTAADAYVNAVEFNLPQEQKTLSNMAAIPLLPYHLTINKFTPQVFIQDIELTLDYTLDKDTSYNVFPTNRKLLLTIEGLNTNDGTVSTYFSQDLTLEGTDTNTLQPGKNNTITLKKTFDYDSINGNLVYSAKLYEIVGDSKKLIAEHPIYWFIENDWTKDIPQQ